MSTDSDKIAEMKHNMDLEVSTSRHLEAAQRFEAGMDKVVDVLLMLVLKFGRATTAQVVNLFLLFMCLLILVISTINVSYLRDEVKDLMYQQEDLMRAQKRIEQTTEATKKDVATTSEQVTKVAEATPKIEVDEKTGKAKLIVDDQKTVDLKVVPEKKSNPRKK